MWHKTYKDYPEDLPLKKFRAEPSNGMVGVEMNEPNGWGVSFHQYKERKKGKLATFLSTLFHRSKEKSR